MPQAVREGAKAMTTARRKAGPMTPREFPVREYVGAMAAELALMARWDGDEQLACALEIAVELASRPPGPPGPVEAPEPTVKRPS